MVVSYGTAYGPYIDICSSYDLEASYGSANGTYIGVCSSYALVAHHMGVLVCDLSCRQLSLKNPVKPFPEFRWFGWSGGVQYWSTVWTALNNFEHYWITLNSIGVQFEQYWTSLNSIEQLWTVSACLLDKVMIESISAKRPSHASRLPPSSPHATFQQLSKPLWVLLWCLLLLRFWSKFGFGWGCTFLLILQFFLTLFKKGEWGKPMFKKMQIS